MQRAVERKLGIPVVVGTGSNSTKAAVRLTEEAVDLGADAVLVVVPYYNKPTPAGLIAHFRLLRLQRALSLLLSTMSQGAPHQPCALCHATALKIENIRAVKESSGNLAQIGEICRALPEGKTVLSGDDGLALPSIAVGAEGLVSVAANVMPRRFRALVDAARAGRRQDAKTLHGELAFYGCAFCGIQLIPVKAALKLCGLAGDGLRLPLVSATKPTKELMESVPAALGCLL